MAALTAIPAEALKAQAESSDPRASVWVSANAGSGKTHVLTERVIRLLLRGTPPARILCLTYTKAAAANMQSRIFARLGQWTALDDTALSQALERLEGAAPDSLKLNQARRLFAAALETPGGLKIQTIHAFCEALLHQFPLEANIPGHFEMMDDKKQAECIAAVKKQLFAEIYLDKDSAAAAAFHLILEKAGEDALDRLLKEAVAHKQDLSPASKSICQKGSGFFLDILGLRAEAKTAAAQKADIKTVLAENLRQNALFAEADLAEIEKFGGARAAEFAAKLKSAAKERQSGKLTDLLLAAYFKTDGNARDPQHLFGKKLLAARPDLPEKFGCRAAIAADYADKLKAADLAELNHAAYLLISDLLARYHAAKQARGLMDFGDLIDCTLALLKRRGAGQWVQYKLDQGIDHILVDEAQDTGPEQWEIIRLLSQEFFSGFGAREDLQRSLFAVGDEKQSIYSFQGASPQDFAENGAYVRRKAENAQLLFRHKQLNFSFRSAEDVLAAVDRVFAGKRNYQGLSAENLPPVHSAVRAVQGYVDIWPAFGGESREEPEDWTENLDGSAGPAALLAENITERIAHWLQAGEILPGKNRPITAGDIMILVRNRSGAFVTLLGRALKNRSINVAGADRLLLTGHIAVRDLMALGAFVLQPRDDLALACALKSPLFNFSEETLLRLAAERQGSLWEALEKAARQPSPPQRQKGQEQDNLALAAERLQACRSQADTKPVYEFYSKILAEDGGRRAFLARLGNEAGDILDAFLDYCLSAEQSGLPGLQNFLQDLSRSSPEIKRELDQNRDEIRIMTVHAAKGLEAPIVFLADNGSAIWHSRHAPCLLPLPKPAKDGPHHPAGMRLWLPKAAFKTRLAEQILGELKQKAEEEYRRLLYVGMTRAEDRLIVCGYHGAKPQGDTWLPLVSQALAGETEAAPYAAGGAQARRYWRKKPEALPPSAAAAVLPAAKTAALPAFLTEKAAAEPRLPKPLTPSGAGYAIEAEADINPDFISRSPILPDSGADKAENSPKTLFGAVEKGRLIHSLLQYLPDIAPQKRRSLARAYVESRLGADNAAWAETVLADIFRILEDAQFAALFTPFARAEIGLMGQIAVKGKKRVVSGQIDRLAISDNQVLFADYKTGMAPAKAADIPAAYKMQMALYAALLTAIYPQKQVKALLIYTRSGRVFPFAAADLLPLLR